jgi:hypothetical protein
MSDGWNDHHFLFICGLHRSGTTVLQRCLSDHPAISAFHDTGVIEDEGQYLQSVFPVEATYGGAGRMAFDTACHMTESSLLVNDESRARLFSDWSRHWDLSRRFLVEKTPMNLLKTRLLQALFPNSSFIVVLRHPFAVALATHKFSHTGLHALIDHWLLAHEIFERDQSHLERVRVLSYERLVAEPRAVFDEIAAFLGTETWDCKVSLRPGINDTYFARWSDWCSRQGGRDKAMWAFRDRAVRKLAREIARRVHPGLAVADLACEAEDATARFRERIEHFGYSVTDLAGANTRF